LTIDSVRPTVAFRRAGDVRQFGSASAVEL